MKQDKKRGEKNKIGAMGEAVAALYTKRHGLALVETNYLKKWGEIDLVTSEITKNGPIMHFIEVKTVSYGTRADLNKAVSYGTWRPEENVHPQKIARLNRAIESWIVEHNYEGAWQIDVCAVRIVPHEKYATVKYIPNIILD
ncbi:MAG TPA: YraN family protein [Candidatus Paceibacterota bacterium]